MGNADFPVLVGRAGQGEAIMKATAFMAIHMYTIGRLERSVMQCTYGCQTEECKQEATGALDEAVAYYAGSLADHNKENNTGVLLFALAENRAHNFRTAGHELGTKDSGTAYVNIHVVNRFRELQSFLKAGDVDSCKKAFDTKKEIIRLMKIPLIQSVLGYAYIRDRDELRDEDEIEKTEAKGATYAASVIPYIHHCNPKSAETLYNHMKIGSNKDKVNYIDIKHAFESTYECLGITCAEVGGIWNGADYVPDASPCGVDVNKSHRSAYFWSFASITGLAIAALLFIRYRKRKNAANKKELMCEGNIHAVSEIA
jgi:Low iron-inducible periplasmic protein